LTKGVFLGLTHSADNPLRTAIVESVLFCMASGRIGEARIVRSAQKFATWLMMCMSICYEFFTILTSTTLAAKTTDA
jgi:hypothetical protein